MTGEQLENYITTQLECKPRHNCEALANAINDIAYEIEVVIGKCRNTSVTYA